MLWREAYQNTEPVPGLFLRERRAYYEAHPEEVIAALTEGTDEARRTAEQTLSDVKKAMQIDYFNQWAEEYGK